jgi:hypothetical protein
MNAMTWYDHNTGSVWSQPWGRAINGELKGIELFLLPSQIASWGSWLKAYPDTLVMTNDLFRLGAFRQRFDPDFVIGLLEEGRFHAYVRQVDNQELTFSTDGVFLIDAETGSRWDVARGLAIEGSLQGQALIGVPSSSAFDWAWLDFYPQSNFYRP